MKAKASEFIEYLESKVGFPYLWGGQGENFYNLVKQVAKKNGQSDANTEKMLDFLEKNGFKNAEFYDCSGLGVHYLLSKKAIPGDMTANGLYSKCEKIKNTEARPGDMCFLINEKGKATHIGYLVKGGYVIHAFNQSKGIIKEKKSVRKWTYGRPDFCIEYDLEESAKEMKAGDKITITEAKATYSCADDAVKNKNKVGIYQPGEYYIFRVFGGAVNITRAKGSPGGWVML